MKGRVSPKGHPRLDSFVRCKPLSTNVSIQKCLDSFVEANAFSNKGSACYKCQQGQRLRNMVARS